MKKPDLKILLLFLMVFSYVIIKIVFNINSILNTFIWLLIFIIANILSISNYDRFKNDNSKISTIFITSISILMIYFLSGLLFGYSKNVLFSNINNIITNSWCYIIIIFFEEYMRQLFISYSKDNKIILFLISLIFIANDINFYSSSFYNTFVNIFLIYIPICLKHFLLTYITYNYGYKNSCFYIFIITAFNIFLPILPNTNWAINSIVQILIPVMLYLILSYEHNLELNNLDIKNLKKENPVEYIPYFIFLLVIFLFINGAFKYKITAVMSNSMYPLFERGDVVITYDVRNISKLKVGDIIKFKRENQYIIHRIYDIYRENENIKFITKGDNNSTVDETFVYKEDICGKYIFKIKYIGYLSVWISEALNN